MNLRTLLEPLYFRILRSSISKTPNHIAIIQDGNRRYAKEMGQKTGFGHRQGANTTEMMLEWAREFGIKHITLYAFSTENFRRNEEELGELFELFKDRFLKVLTDERVHKNKIRVRMVGDKSLLPADVLACVEKAEEATKEYSNHYLNVAIAYGGRNEIVHAARRIITQVRDGTLSPDRITPAMVEANLYGGLGLPPVDLIIRTGNEYRTSNFLPWLANGNESSVYFCAPYWPQFRKIDLLRAIRVYDQRKRSGSKPSCP
ncbi:MAG: polyprenyl diphosphate synthase [Methanocalculus sp.]|uniref:polyprenyl diphosphate synthase n=1 Tax=Methanocalculus sp. TaxID=2004547 RepID=UPI00271586A4|nr:polyprenyl diphosphate synthase [Methanocalculus sp.]MDO9540000.1 polyprenyl diphosphate synthase [Methanocalculus sp.]